MVTVSKLAEGDWRESGKSMISSIKSFFSFVKADLSKEYRIRVHGGPVPPASDYNWGVTWTGHPTKEIRYDKEGLLQSFTVWHPFTVGTLTFWLDRLNHAFDSASNKPKSLHDETLTETGRMTKKVMEALYPTPESLQARKAALLQELKDLEAERDEREKLALLQTPVA